MIISKISVAWFDNNRMCILLLKKIQEIIFFKYIIFSITFVIVFADSSIIRLWISMHLSITEFASQDAHNAQNNIKYPKQSMRRNISRI